MAANVNLEVQPRSVLKKLKDSGTNVLLSTPFSDTQWSHTRGEGGFDLINLVDKQQMVDGPSHSPGTLILPSIKIGQIDSPVEDIKKVGSNTDLGVVKKGLAGIAKGLQSSSNISQADNNQMVRVSQGQ